MTNYSAGHAAEQVAANFIGSQGFKIRELNWKTNYCEVDIVAEKDDRIYFVEVKYRHSDNQGSGLDYITPNKLRQMAFAAEMWVSDHDWPGDYQLAAIELSDLPPRVTNFLTDL